MVADIDKPLDVEAENIVAGIERRLDAILLSGVKLVGATAGVLLANAGAQTGERIAASFGIDEHHLAKLEGREAAAFAQASKRGSGWRGELHIVSLSADALDGDLCDTHWLRTQQIEHVLVALRRGALGQPIRLLLFRKAGLQDFSDSQRDVVGNLVPMLAQVVELGDTARELARAMDLSQAALDRIRHGVIFLAGDGQLFGANAAGRNLLAEGDGLQAGLTGMHASSQHDAKKLRQVIANSRLRPESFPHFLSVSRPSGRKDLQLAVSAVPRQSGRQDHEADSLVMVADPDGPAELNHAALMELMGLTPAEARLLAGIAQGCSLREVADDLGIKMSTARTYVARLLSKTGTRRQPELLGLAMQTLASLDYT